MRRRDKKTFSLTNFFKPIINAASNLTGQILRHSLETTAGIEVEEHNPDAFLEKKGKDLTFYDTMLLDDRIKFVTDLKKKLILNVPNKIVPASEEKEDLEKAEFVQDVFDNLKTRFKDVLDNMMDAMIYGFKIGEIIWKSEDGKWKWDKVKFKHSIFFNFKYDKFKNMDKLLIGKFFGTPQQEIDVPTFNNKFLYFVWPYLKDDNMYGDSDLREIYTQWYAKFHIFRWRNVYLQNNGQPIPIVKFDKDKVSSGEKDEMKDLLENFQDQMYLLIPSLRDLKSGELRGKFEIDFRDTSTKKGTDVFDKAIDQIDKQITRKLLVPDKMGFTEDGAGSFAQSRKMFDILLMIVKDAQQRLEDTINPKIQQMIDFNWASTENYPTWEFEEIDKGIEKDMLELLLNSGVIDKREQWIRSFQGIPEITDKEKKEIEKEKEADFEKQQERMREQGGDDDTNGNSDDSKLPDRSKDGDKSGSKDDIPKGQGREFKTKNAPVNFKKIELQFDTFEDMFLTDFSILHEEQVQKLIKQVENKKIVETKNLKLLDELRIKKTDLKKLITSYYAKLYFTGKVDVVKEMKPRFKQAGFQDEITMKAVEFDDKWLDKEFINGLLADLGPLGVLTADDKTFLKSIRDRGFTDVKELEEKMTKITTQTVTSGIRNGLTGGAINAQIEQFLRDDKKRFAGVIARTNASTDYNNGRNNFFKSPSVDPFIEAFQYSSIIDNATTQFCAQHDGQIIKKGDPEVSVINPPNHFQCRSLLIAIMLNENELEGSFYEGYQENKTDFPDWGTRVNKDNRLPAKGFGGV
jgi:SPP1 gp7 family putative phage head morphogenesis protein